MSAEFEPPETVGENSIIRGCAPVSELSTYQGELIGYTKGKGKISCTLNGYRPCHNSDEVIENFSYDCDGDLENSADSIFCSHGAGFVVKWNEVPEHMHLPSILDTDDSDNEEAMQQKARKFIERAVSDEELMEILSEPTESPKLRLTEPFKRQRLSVSMIKK